MPEQTQDGGRCARRILLCLAAISVPLLSSCGKRDVSKTPTEIAKPLGEGPREVQRVPVKSSNLQSVGYDDSSRILTIEFRNGSIYEYQDVPAEVYAALMSAQSHGKYFHGRIRDAGYAMHRVR